MCYFIFPRYIVLCVMLSSRSQSLASCHFNITMLYYYYYTCCYMCCKEMGAIRYVMHVYVSMPLLQTGIPILCLTFGYILSWKITCLGRDEMYVGISSLPCCPAKVVT
ncbi:uncharacterized protein F4812DRAFT_424694 [Daldinia caldariorum]|uniref:uncharacterized protein n=1 Tax=Daldinia caldariorum TaxID=326644 RepID=UPI0020079E60|nr:uncharacterized protein F4812DRAFT_424694 [Daldinia caldariorum]KAI1468782.1 hypothetical protein F4812DRAFT_424694 [Daldinia caldariorum]